MLTTVAILAFGQANVFQGWPNNKAIPSLPEEPHLVNIRQLTFGGQNAEAYWNLKGDMITFQSRQPGFPDEQIFTMKADGSGKRLVSTGLGRCTCSYLDPDGKHIYFSSTHAKDPGPQKPVDMSKGYVWMVNPNFTLYRANLDGSGVAPLISKPGYVAEATVAPNRKFITFTGDYEGDIDIYRADIDGTHIKKLTNEFGYDGGPFVSYDSKKIVYRRDVMPDEKSRTDYADLHKENLVRPSKLEIWIMDADGSNKQRVTNLNCASFAPFLHPNGKTIIFCSNYGDPKGREFNLFTINVDGTNLQQITKSPEFDGFPMWTRDGKHLVFASNRNGSVRGETNVFVADWKD